MNPPPLADKIPANAAVEYAVHNPFWQVVDHWQTLITGLLALVAAVGTIIVTNQAANREISAANLQIADARRAERRNRAREGYAFAAMVDGAMDVLVAEVRQARKLIPSEPKKISSTDAYQARTMISRTGFAEIKAALAVQGGQVASLFLVLDRTISALSGRARMERPYFGAGMDVPEAPVGQVEGLADELTALERMAKQMQDHSQGVMKTSQKTLAETDPTEPVPRG